MRGNKLMDTLAFFCSSVPKYKGHLLLQSASGVAYCNHDAQIRREEPHGNKTPRPKHQMARYVCRGKCFCHLSCYATAAVAAYDSRPRLCIRFGLACPFTAASTCGFASL